jgi:predicted PurR-regulated permease PerM
MVTWLVLSGSGTVEQWSQIATIFVVFLGLVLGFVVLVILAGLVYLIFQILRFLPPYARLTQNAIEKINEQIRSGADISAQPVIQIKSFIAMIDVLLGRK